MNTPAHNLSNGHAMPKSGFAKFSNLLELVLLFHLYGPAGRLYSEHRSVAPSAISCVSRVPVERIDRGFGVHRPIVVKAFLQKRNATLKCRQTETINQGCDWVLFIRYWMSIRHW
jgi:hypothetical protein